jgi:hypothetical protein
MKQHGARAQSAVAVRVSRSFHRPEPKPVHVIDQLFLVWIRRPGIDLPLFYGHITEEHWKKPRDLDTP